MVPVTFVALSSASMVPSIPTYIACMGLNARLVVCILLLVAADHKISSDQTDLLVKAQRLSAYAKDLIFRLCFSGL